MSSPHLFDQAIVAQPCKAGCRAHVHAPHLPSAYTGPDVLEVGAGTPKGWTVQGTPPPEAPSSHLMWFQCNVCDALVSELDVSDHRCG